MGQTYPKVSTNYGVNSFVSRSKIFKGRPDRLLIDQRAILVKMPDFTDAPPLEEPEPDDFLYDESFVIEEEEELEAAPLRVFIGTANISEIQEDNSLVESGAMVWDLSAMVESDDDDDFEIFDSFDNDEPAAATIQLGGAAPLVQTAVTPPTQAWALDDGDEDLELDDIPNEPIQQAHVSVGTVRLPLAIPDEQVAANVSAGADSVQVQLSTALLNDNADEDSEDNWGVYPDEPDDTPVIDVAARQRLGLSDASNKIELSQPKSSSPSKVAVMNPTSVRELGEAPATDPIFQLPVEDEDDAREVTEEMTSGASGAPDLDEPPDPKSIQLTAGSIDNDDNIFREGFDVYAHELDLASVAPSVVPEEETEESSSHVIDPIVYSHPRQDNRFVWIVIALLFVAVLVMFILNTN